MTIQDLTRQCGTVTVRVGPLLMLIGAVMSSEHAPDLGSIVEMLDTEQEDDDE